MEIRKLMYAEQYEKNGEKKNAWKECGVLFINDKGNISIKLTSFPLSGSMIAFPNKPKEEGEWKKRDDGSEIKETAKEKPEDYPDFL